MPARLFFFALILILFFPSILFAESLAERIGIPEKTWEKLMKEKSLAASKIYKRNLLYLSGSHQEMGTKLAQFLKFQNNSLHRDLLLDLSEGKTTLDQVLSSLPQPLSIEKAKAWEEELQKWTPNHLEEMRGLATELKIPILDMLRILGFLTVQGGCSAVGIKPVDGSGVIVGFNYDFHPAIDDGLLVFRKPKKGYATLGNAMLPWGLYDGINEKGLFIASTLVMDDQKHAGIFSGFVVRQALENAANTSEAIAIFSQLPLRDSYSYMVADRQGDLAVIEANRGELKVRRAKAGDHGIGTSNVFEHPEMTKANRYLMPNAITRSARIKKFLRTHPNSTQKQLSQWMRLAYEKGGINLSYFEPYILGNMYHYTVDLKNLEFTYYVAGSQQPSKISLKKYLKSPPKTNGYGLVKTMKGEMNNLNAPLYEFGDFDWWASPDPKGWKGFSLVAGSINPLGIMMENRFVYRQPLGNPVWGPYLDFGLRQTITPVFHRIGPMVRWSNKKFIDLELSLEQANYFNGLSETKDGSSYVKADPAKRLEEKNTISFSSQVRHLSIQLYHSFGPLVLLNHWDGYQWSKPNEREAFYNFETGLSQAFGRESRNNLMLLVPFGAPTWSAGLFSQVHQNHDESGRASFQGLQTLFMKWGGTDEALIRIGMQSHSDGQPNAPEGFNFVALWKFQWR